MMKYHLNHVELIGRLQGVLNAVTNKNGDTFFDGTLAVQRLSGTFDYLPITIPARLINNGCPTLGSLRKLEECRRLRMVGELRTYNKELPGKIRHHTVLLVREFKEENQATDDNHVEMEGVICREPYYHETPFGREICSFTIAVNRSCNRSAYIPCICWGLTAWMVSGLEVGTKVALLGRFQSREYQKQLDNGKTETRTTYEVSCKCVDVVEVAEEWVNGSV